MGIKEGQTVRSTALFDQFCRVSSLRGTLNIFQQLCDEIQLDRTDHRNFYRYIRSKLRSWKAVSLWNKLDKRASQEIYKNQTVCASHRALVIGAGPCGLRTAIELTLLGSKVVVLEKRDSFSRNNVIHLWPFVIHDLRSLGAKKFYGKFCSGSIDHISIKQVQLMLCKIALLLGVEIHINTSFEALVQPSPFKDCGWHGEVTPSDHPISLYEFDILIGADGRRNSLEGFPRKEFRGKLAIGITANFVNLNSKAEAQVEEISGLSYIYNQRFFQDLKRFSGIDLENIVYYKDETHYFVMTAKKQSLLEKSVLIEDNAEIGSLLVRQNVNQDELKSYAKEAARAATNGQLPDLEFAKNSLGMEDIAMFDFTSLFAAENASRIVIRNGYTLLMALVGDSLLEPFWPTGTGCARGFLSSLDAAWMVRQWSIDVNPLEVIAERESLYQLLSQTTPNNMSKDHGSLTLNPKTRYQKLMTTSMKSSQVRHLYEDDGTGKKNININLSMENTVPKPKPKYFGDYDRVLRWFQYRMRPYENLVKVDDLSSSWLDGRGLYCILHHFHPELVDLKILTDMDANRVYQRACDIIEKVYEVSPRVTANEIAEQSVDAMKMFGYLDEVCHAMAAKHKRSHSYETAEEKMDKDERKICHRGPSHRMLPSYGNKVEVKAVKRPCTMMTDEAKEAARNVFLEVTGARPRNVTSPTRSPPSRSRVRDMATELFFSGVKDECGSSVSEVRRRIRDDATKPRDYPSPTRRYSDMPLCRPGIEDLIKQMNERKEKRHLEAKELFEKELEKIRSPNQDLVRELTQAKNDLCYLCSNLVQPLERMSLEGYFLHKSCLKCTYCRAQLHSDQYAFKFTSAGEGRFYCFQHVGMSRKTDGDVVTKKKEAYENVKLRSKSKSGIDTTDSRMPERAEFSIGHRRSIIEDNSWNLRDFLYSADMEEEFNLSDAEISEEEYDSDEEDDDEDDERDEENNSTKLPNRPSNAAKYNFFSQVSQPVRIDPWAFFEREMGFKLVVKDEVPVETAVTSSPPESSEDSCAQGDRHGERCSPEWDDADLMNHDAQYPATAVNEEDAAAVHDVNSNLALNTHDEVDFIDADASDVISANISAAENATGYQDRDSPDDELVTSKDDPKRFKVIQPPMASEENIDSATNSPIELQTINGHGTNIEGDDCESECNRYQVDNIIDHSETVDCELSNELSLSEICSSITHANGEADSADTNELDSGSVSRATKEGSPFDNFTANHTLLPRGVSVSAPCLLNPSFSLENGVCAISPDTSIEPNTENKPSSDDSTDRESSIESSASSDQSQNHPPPNDIKPLTEQQIAECRALMAKYTSVSQVQDSSCARSPFRIGSTDTAGLRVTHYSIVGKSQLTSPKSPCRTTDVGDALKMLLGGKK